MKRTIYCLLTLALCLSGLLYTAAQGQATLPCEESLVPVPCIEVATQAYNLALVTQLADLVGIWRRYVPPSSLNASSRGAYQHIHRDGGFTLADTLVATVSPHGSYSFEGGVLVLTLEGQSASSGCETSRFEARLYRYGVQPVALLLTPVGESCSELNGNLPLVWVGAQQGNAQAEATAIQAANAEEEAFIQVVLAKEAAYAANDPDRYLSFFADDVLSLLPDTLPIAGKAALEADRRALFDAYEVEANFELISVELSGDYATRYLQYWDTLIPKDGGEPIRMSGSCMEGWKRIDGEWKVVWEIFNDQPLPPPQ